MMRGHQPLIDMRRRGIRPGAVWFSVDEPDFSSRDWHLRSESAVVEIEPDESILTLDLRFVVGMTAIVQGSQTARCKALHRACMTAGASTVVTHVSQPDGKLNESFETVLQMVGSRTTVEVA